MPWVRYSLSVLLIAGWTGFIKLVFPHIELINLVMTYLLVNVLIAVRFGQGPSVVSAILSVAVFDFFFVPPHLTFAVADVKYFVTFLIMLVVTLLTSRLTVKARKKSEEANQARITAEKEAMISSLLSSFSHDLRTPLTSIMGAASTLVSHEAGLSQDDRRRLYETIYEESDRLNRLTANLFQITKVESGNLQMKKDRHSLEEIIGSALNRLESSIKERPISTHIPDDLVLIPLDDVLIEQVLINLIENAVRYTPSGSPIEIRTIPTHRKVMVEIADRGAGLPLEDQERIFEKFCRRDATGISGSGLGLAICRGIVQAHGGAIGVRSREGGGSIFYFTLPLEASKP